ncbi:MAG: PqqD family protein [Bacteroidaceae bacterium]|nr:PqqD family protein [Bacteroidaceae bacterium]
MKVKKGFELQNVCNEYLLIPAGIENVDFSNIISMNETSAYLWEKVAEMENFDTETLVDLLLKEYNVDKETATEDCNLIIERWMETGIIEE